MFGLVRTAADVSSRGKTHAQTRKRAQMATQVDPGMWNMPGEEQVTAGLGYVCLFFFIPPGPIETLSTSTSTPPRPGNAHVPHGGLAEQVLGF